MDGTSTLNYKTVEMGGFAEEPDLTNVSLGDADAAILQEAEQDLQQSDTELESNRESLQGLRDESALPNPLKAIRFSRRAVPRIRPSIRRHQPQ
mgnify:CR=1 FL=1